MSIKNGRKDSNYVKLQEATGIVSEVITRRKEEYQNHIALKLNYLMTTTKTYWSILKTFCSGKKLPLILPLLINDKLISDFAVKANHFNNFFASQCTPLDDSSKNYQKSNLHNKY